MTCLFHPRLVSKASGTTSKLLQQQWRPLSTQLRHNPTPNTKNPSSASSNGTRSADLEREKLWQEIHSLELFLGLPQTKSTDRWREKRLRGKAADLFEQKLQKTPPASEASADSPPQAIPTTPLIQQLYKSIKKEGGTARQRTAPSAKASRSATKSDKKTGHEPARRSDRTQSTQRSKHSSTAQGNDRGIERPPRSKKDMEQWQIQKEALDKKFKDQIWAPRKRLSPDTIDGIRMLHKSDPEAYPNEVLSKQFEVSSEAIRRILKSKWIPDEDEAEDRRLRWERRGEKIWTSKVEMGVKPPKKWRQMGVGRVGPGETPRWKQRRTNKPEAIPWGESVPSTVVEDHGVDQGSISDQIL